MDTTALVLAADATLEQLAVALQHVPDAALVEVLEQRQAHRLARQTAVTAVTTTWETADDDAASSSGGRGGATAMTTAAVADGSGGSDGAGATAMTTAAAVADGGDGGDGAGATATTTAAAVQRDDESPAPTSAIEWHRLDATYEIHQQSLYPTAIHSIPRSAISQLITCAVGCDVEVTAGAVAQIRERLAGYTRALLRSAIIHAQSRCRHTPVGVVGPRDVLAACDENTWALDARPRVAPADTSAWPSASSPLAHDATQLRRSHAGLARVDSALALLDLLGEPLRYASPLRAGVAPHALAAPRTTRTTLARALKELALVKSAGDDGGDAGDPWRRWRGFESAERCSAAMRRLFPLGHRVPARLWQHILGFLDFADQCTIAFAEVENSTTATPPAAVERKKGKSGKGKAGKKGKKGKAGPDHDDHDRDDMLGIDVILRQVHPSLTLSRSGARVMLGMLRAVEEELGPQALAFAWARQKGYPAACAVPVIHADDMIAAVLLFPAGGLELGKHASAEGAKALMKHEKASASTTAAREIIPNVFNARVREIRLTRELEGSDASGLLLSGLLFL